MRPGVIAATRSSALARTLGSSTAIRRAEKALTLCTRIRVCLGGSQLDMVGVAPKPCARISWARAASGKTGAWVMAAEYVAGSLKMASMSACRVTTHISRLGA